ncbi:MAG: HNH/ENDO VII family nuclease [Candidatus Riflebacteria bacterium]|nr:HNH/ENDO VII family nuclease [Candidatus Riflebacteria bacterium]
MRWVDPFGLCSDPEYQERLTIQRHFEDKYFNTGNPFNYIALVLKGAAAWFGGEALNGYPRPIPGPRFTSSPAEQPMATPLVEPEPGEIPGEFEFGPNTVGAAQRPYSNPKSRPPYGPNQVEATWENAKQLDGKVYDPNTGQELIWDKKKPRTGQWDMGHIPGKEYRKLHQDYIDGKISYQEFIKTYKNPKNYRPEAVGPNRSGVYEEP